MCLPWASASETAGPGDPGGLLPPLTPEGRQDFEKLAREMLPPRKKPRIIIMDATVTLNGQPRADLGASFADTMSAKILASNAYEVIDSSALGTSAPSALEVARTALDPQGNPSATPGMALDLGKASGADFVIVPTLISLSDELRLTIRKLQIPSGKIDSILQDTARGDQRAIFALAERAAGKLLPQPAPEPVSTAPRYDYVKVWMAPPTPPDPIKQAILAAPKALKADPALAAARAWSGSADHRDEPHRIGQIMIVDTNWSFCEINCPPASVKLREQIFAWGGGAGDNLIRMTISRIEGSRIIAEFDALQPVTKTLRPGLAVYTWQMPAK